VDVFLWVTSVNVELVFEKIFRIILVVLEVVFDVGCICPTQGVTTGQFDFDLVWLEVLVYHFLVNFVLLLDNLGCWL
jgi:hypothetical protein